MNMKTPDYISHRKLYAYELTRLRSEQGFSKSDFATMVGVSRRHLVNLESAKVSPTLEMMERIAAGLDVPVSDMVDFETILQRRLSTASSTLNSPDIITKEYRE